MTWERQKYNSVSFVFTPTLLHTDTHGGKWLRSTSAVGLATSAIYLVPTFFPFSLSDDAMITLKETVLHSTTKSNVLCVGTCCVCFVYV